MGTLIHESVAHYARTCDTITAFELEYTMSVTGAVAGGSKCFMCAAFWKLKTEIDPEASQSMNLRCLSSRHAAVTCAVVSVGERSTPRQVQAHLCAHQVPVGALEAPQKSVPDSDRPLRDGKDRQRLRIENGDANGPVVGDGLRPHALLVEEEEALRAADDAEVVRVPSQPGHLEVRERRDGAREVVEVTRLVHLVRKVGEWVNVKVGLSDGTSRSVDHQAIYPPCALLNVLPHRGEGFHAAEGTKIPKLEHPRTVCSYQLRGAFDRLAANESLRRASESAQRTFAGAIAYLRVALQFVDQP